jgi:tRNA threonylcarbamoyl adenosine modification protein YeaZ
MGSALFSQKTGVGLIPARPALELFVLILAIDTCDSRGSVAVLQDSTVVHVIPHDAAQDYSAWLLPAVNAALDQAHRKISDIDVYAIACGPGSFTGVRAGLTAVKAWAEVHDRRIAAVSRLAALASPSTGQHSWVASFTDAHRGQVFGGLYRRGTRDLQLVDQEVVMEPSGFVGWAESQSSGDHIDWISPDPVCLTQTPAWQVRREAGDTMQLDASPLAPAIGRIGFHQANSGQLVDALGLDANYVRRPDAELFWKSKLAAGSGK